MRNTKIDTEKLRENHVVGTVCESTLNDAQAIYKCRACAIEALCDEVDRLRKEQT